MDLKGELQKFFKGDIADDRITLKKYSHDASLFEVKPSLVVFPKDAEDIKNLVRFSTASSAGLASENKISLTPRSGGTDMTGGPLTESLVVDLARYFNRVHEVGDGYAVTDPGVYYRDFEKATLDKGWLMPSYPASREICTVGGMVANNAGGEKSLAYGKTENYVAELSVVLRDGQEHVIKPLSQSELEEKIKRNDFEGELYRDIYKLVSENKEVLALAKPDVSKNSAGYYLWNVWDGKTFDLNKLIVGSQGTLGVITKIKFKLIKPKAHSKMLAIFLKDLGSLAEIISRILARKPESFESYDDHTFKLAIRYWFDFLKLMKASSAFSLAWKFLPEFFMVLTGGIPKMVLLAEFTGDNEEEVNQKALAARNSLAELNLKTRLTHSAKESQKYWLMRRESFNLLRHHIKDKHTAPFIDDMVVRPELLPKFLPELNEVMSHYKIVYTIAGHVGDGNFHIIPLMNLSDPESRRIIPELSKKVYDLVIKYHGSITGEHNDGLIRTPFLKQMYGEKVYGLFEQVKKLFDPDNIFNPGKKVNASINYAMEHLEK